MALNGSVSVEATPKGQDLLVFSWSAVQDAAANTSTVSWIMQLVASTAGAINGVPVERAWSVTVDGQEFTGTADVNISNNETKTLASGEIVLEHAEDGTRSFAFAFSQDLSINWVASSEFIGTVSGSGTGELDTIAEPEPEKFDIQGFMMGLAMALCGRPVQWPKREPVQLFLYGKPSENGNIGLRSGNIVTLYDGAVMPPIPEAVKAYRYQNFSIFGNTGYKNLFGFNVAPETREISSGGLFPSTDVRNGQFQEAPYYRQTASITQTEWHIDAGYAGTGTTDVALEDIKWANYDVLNLDGSVYLAASNPIPVSGIVDYIDNIPIYEVI